MRFEFKTFVFFILSQFPKVSYSQKDINIGIAPLALIGKLAISAEIEGKKKLAFGSTFSYNYSNVWTGLKAEISMRYYLAKLKEQNNSEGIYAIVQSGMASFKTPYSVEEVTSISILYPKPIYTTNTVYLSKERTSGHGIGVGFGYKRSIKRFFLDFNFRYQSWQVNSKPILYRYYKNKDKVAFKPYTNSAFQSSFLIGPGSIFAPTLIFGYTIK